MKVVFAAAAYVVLFAAAVSQAQEDGQKRATGKFSSPEPEMSLGQLTPTPEMWFYEQALRRYRDPKSSVRRRAEFEADQRQARLAAQRWFGFSTSRPTVNITPFTNGYSPMWMSSSPYGNQWRGVSRTTIIVPGQQARPSVGYGLW